jgi:exonuclease III
MKFFFWNIRGFGQIDRKRQLKRFLRQSRFDVVGLQETIKVDFSDRELASLVEGLPFVWTWVSAVGHSGGILLGANSDTFEVGTIDKGEFFASIVLHQRNNGFKWEAITVYGPADHSRSVDFLAELHNKIANSPWPVVITGDFNLTRGASENSNLSQMPSMTGSLIYPCVRL